MGYSRYGSSGRGLSDKGYAKYVTKRSDAGIGTVIKNPMSYLMGMAQLGTPVGWAGKSGYTGSVEEQLVHTTALNTTKKPSEVGRAGTTTGYGKPTGSGIGQRGVQGQVGLKGGQLEDVGGGVSVGSMATIGVVGYLAYMLVR